MGLDDQASKDEAESVPSETEKCPAEEEEIESKTNKKTAGSRCFQGNRETSLDDPSELGASVLFSSDPVFLLPQQSAQHRYLDSDFVELTAEVRVPDCSSIALLTASTGHVGYQKAGYSLNENLLFPVSSRIKRHILSLDTFSGWISGGVHPLGQMHLSLFSKSSQGVNQTAKSPSSPSNSPSSPSSTPSSPSSSSPGGMGSNYHDYDERRHVEDCRANKGTGDFVSSTSSHLVPSSKSVSTSNASLHASSRLPCNEGQKVENDIYDPFHPTDGEGDRDQDSTEDEEEEVDKYDPFEPTGSPASETEEVKHLDDEIDEESRIIERGNAIKSERTLEFGEGATIEDSPPDSTEAVASSSVFSNVIFQIKSTRSIKHRLREQGTFQSENATDSDHSELEEGEIGGASEKSRELVIERRREVLLPSSLSPPYLQGGGPKPERILRVLEGDGFVSVRADAEWERQQVASVGIGDLRRKLTSRRKERFISCPSPASLSPPPAPVLPVSSPQFPASPSLSNVKVTSHKSSKSSKDSDRRKRKEGKGDKEKRKKRKEGKDSNESRKQSKERNREKKSEREKEKERDKERSNPSGSHKRKRHTSSQEHSSRSHSHSTSHVMQSHRSWSSHSDDHPKDRDRDKDKDREKDRSNDRDRERDRWHDDRSRDRDSRRRDEPKRDRDDHGRRLSRDRSPKRQKGSSDRREREKDLARDRDRERRRTARPVVPPSIQDLNGSDLFAIKRTITVTTTTTTTTVPSSPPHSKRRSRSHSQSSENQRKKTKRRRRSVEEEKKEEHRNRSRPSSITPPRYHGYESDRPEVDMLSLDGEALDSDYPSLEDSPLLPPPPEPTLASPKIKPSAPKTSRHHLKKKSRPSKAGGQSESTSSSRRPKNKTKKVVSSFSPPLPVTTANSTPLQLKASSSVTKRGRKTTKDKIGKKDGGHSVRSKKLGGSRKGKLQSKVSVLVREGVSSTTGNSGKLGIDLLGSSGVISGSSGPSVVGGSIAVVFRRDNESRSPFLKPCSETLALPGRVKDLGKTGKHCSIIAPPSSKNPSGLKSKKAKPSSATSTSSSASSPTSSLTAKRRRRQAKKSREKGATVNDNDGKTANSGTVGGNWTSSTELQPLAGVGSKPSSPPSALLVPTLSSSSSSSSSSASILPPSSSPPHTSPMSLPPSRDTRESSPDSQTVDSSCKTPEQSFFLEEGPGQSKASSLTPSKSPSSPPNILTPQIRGDAISQSTSTKPVSPEDRKASPPRSTPSLASVSASISHSSAPLANDLSSSSSSVSSSSVNKPPPPPPPPPTDPLPWSLQTGVDCTAGGVLALTALLFKMEEANIASRAKAQEFIQATSQILSQANQSQPQTLPSSSSSTVSSQIPPPPAHGPPPGPSPGPFILHSSVPLVGCTSTPPSLLHASGGCAQTPPVLLPSVMPGAAMGTESGWDSESKDPDKYLKKLHTQERAVEEVKLAIKPYYQRKDINKDDYKDILRKAVHKICHSRTGEINPVKVSNLVKLYVQRYKYFRKHGRKMDEEEKEDRESVFLHSST